MSDVVVRARLPLVALCFALSLLALSVAASARAGDPLAPPAPSPPPTATLVDDATPSPAPPSPAAPIGELPGEAAGLPDVPVPAAPPTGPILEDVRFDGRVYFREETLRQYVRHPIPGALDTEQLQSDAREMTARFQERGYLTATVHVDLEGATPPRGRRAVFTIVAGDRAELREVHVIGNHLVEERALTEGFFSRAPEPLGFLTRAGFFHRPYLDQDAQRLVANYYKLGHLEARVTGTRVEATSDLRGLIATFDVAEGPVYELASLVFDGDLPPGSVAEVLRSGISIQDGGIADLVTIQRDSDALLEPWREAGFPFARFQQSVEVRSPPSGRADRRAIQLRLTFVKGSAATVRHVLITGNKGTADHVIRRDVTVVEGTSYDHHAVRETQARVQRTGYFSAVAVRAVPTDEPEVVDVEVSVTEQPTWLLNLAPAFISNEGLILVGIAADRNLLGTGLSGSLVGQLSGLRQLFDITLTEPRLLDTRLALSIEAHRRQLSYRGFDVTSVAGGGVRALFPLPVDGLGIGAGIGVEYGGVVPRQGVDFSSLAPTLAPHDVLRNVVSLSISYDTRDSTLSPRRGLYAELASSYAGPLTLSGRPGSFDGFGFLSTTGNVRLFWSPLWDITLKSNTELGFAFNPHGGDVPVTDRFFLGGLGAVRGFIPRSIGPHVLVPFNKAAGDDALPPSLEPIDVGIGGTTQVVQNLEVEFPLWPGTPFRAFAFVDAGNAYSDAELTALFQGRAPGDRGARLPLGLFWSTGFGFLLETPVAPFRFEWSFPLTRRVGDPLPDFFFGIGSAF